MASIKANARKVVCVGRNYADHIKELNNVRPKQPFFFLKPSSSILLPKSGPMLAPKGVNLHYEVELGCIIGKEMRDLDPDDEVGALEGVKGYALCIDMTARNMQEEAKKKGLPWSIAKGFDTFLPISNYIEKSSLPDPHDVQLSLAVNGEVRQDDNTNLMLFRIPTLLSYISRVMTLEEGDLVLTGTPKGVGKVEVGDIMTAVLKSQGKDVESIEVKVEEKGGIFVYGET